MHLLRTLSGYVALTACVLLVMVGIGISGKGFFRILETTPFMGIAVDAQGNRLPVEGYPQLWFGLAFTLVFAVLGIISAFYILQNRRVTIFNSEHSAD